MRAALQMARQAVPGESIETAVLPPTPRAPLAEMPPRAGFSRRKVLGLIIAAVAVAVVALMVLRGNPPPSTPAATEVLQADVQITLLSSTTSPEYILLQNQGTAPQDLSGWYIESTVGPQTFNFPIGFVLAPGASVRVESYNGAQHAPPQSLLWSPDAVWNNAGDKAILRNAAGKTISSKCYGTQCP
jgi:hypothetical protein